MIRSTLSAFGIAVAFAGSLVSVGAVASPAMAARPQCASNANLWHVDGRLGEAVEQLNRDRHDYGGHRASAINDLEMARHELDRAREDAIRHDGSNPACFTPPSGGDGYDFQVLNQYRSDRFLAEIDRYVGRLRDQLSRDDRDYAGHRASAMQDLQSARGELGAALRYVHQRGY